MKKVTVNDNFCIGCGACVATCNKVFSFNDEDRAEAKDIDINTLNEEDLNDVMDAVEGCPTNAIEIKESE